MMSAAKTGPRTIPIAAWPNGECRSQLASILVSDLAAQTRFPVAFREGERMDRRAEAASHESPAKLSYKFQRLREQIRNAIVSGELAGQLPGERELGKRFNANAKTINKALCDLATEGLVRRFIGRGTFVSQQESPASSVKSARSVHCLTHFSRADSQIDWNALLAAALTAQGDRIESIPAQRASDGVVAVDPARFRSLAQIDALVLPVSAPLTRPLQDRPGDALLFALARRQIPTVVLGAAAGALRTHAVIPDYNVAAFHAAEFLFQLGCTDVIAISAPESSRPEPQAAVAGYQTACARRRREGHLLAVHNDDAAARLNTLNGRLNERTGVLCLGGLVLENVHAALRARRQACALAAVLEPGDDRARALGITAAEFDARRLTQWVARIIAECGRGTPPVEIVVPGSLQIRPAGRVADLTDSAAEACLGRQLTPPH